MRNKQKSLQSIPNNLKLLKNSSDKEFTFNTLNSKQKSISVNDLAIISEFDKKNEEVTPSNHNSQHTNSKYQSNNSIERSNLSYNQYTDSTPVRSHISRRKAHGTIMLLPDTFLQKTQAFHAQNEKEQKTQKVKKLKFQPKYPTMPKELRKHLPQPFDLGRPLSRLVEVGFTHLKKTDHRRMFLNYLVKFKSKNFGDKEWYSRLRKYEKTIRRFVNKLKKAYGVSQKVREIVKSVYEENNHEILTNMSSVDVKKARDMAKSKKQAADLQRKRQRNQTQLPENLINVKNDRTEKKKQSSKLKSKFSQLLQTNKSFEEEDLPQNQKSAPHKASSIPKISEPSSEISEETNQRNQTSKKMLKVRRNIMKKLTTAIGPEKVQQLREKGKLPELGQPEKFNQFNRSGKKAGTFVNRLGMFLLSKKVEPNMTKENALEIASKPQFYALKNSPNFLHLINEKRTEELISNSKLISKEMVNNYLERQDKMQNQKYEYVEEQIEASINSERFFKDKIKRVETRMINKKNQKESLTKENAKNLYQSDQPKVIVNSLNQVRIVQRIRKERSVSVENSSDFIGIGRKLGLKNKQDR